MASYIFLPTRTTTALVTFIGLVEALSALGTYWLEMLDLPPTCET